MNIFVTGTESFIGKELIRQCDQRGIAVTGIDASVKMGTRFTAADIRSPSIAKLIPNGVDAVIHLAALSRDPDCKNNAYNCFDVNVMGTLNMMQAAQTSGAQQFIFASTEWVFDRFADGEPPKSEDSPINIANLTSEYALSKLVSETNLRQKMQHGFCPVTILRFGIIYGPRKENWSAVEAICNSVATKSEVTVGSLRTGRHFIHVSDIASAIIASIGLRGFEIMNIQGDDLVTLADIVETSKRLLGTNPVIKESSAETPSIRRVSNQKVKRQIAWKPDITLEAGLRSVIDHLGLKRP